MYKGIVADSNTVAALELFSHSIQQSYMSFAYSAETLINELIERAGKLSSDHAEELRAVCGGIQSAQEECREELRQLESTVAEIIDHVRHIISDPIDSVTEHKPEAVIKRMVYNDQIRTSRSPKAGGAWNNGERGNGDFCPDPAALFSDGRGGQVTGEHLMGKYGFSCITYENGEPNFMPFRDMKLVDSVFIDQMPGSRIGADGSYNLADRIVAQKNCISVSEVRQYMQQHGLTWHECGDGHTMIAVPTEINAAFSHTGAMAIENSGVYVKVNNEGIWRAFSGPSPSLERKN